VALGRRQGRARSGLRPFLGAAGHLQQLGAALGDVFREVAEARIEAKHLAHEFALALARHGEFAVLLLKNPVEADEIEGREDRPGNRCSEYRAQAKLRTAREYEITDPALAAIMEFAIGEDLRQGATTNAQPPDAAQQSGHPCPLV
jgi:hypothetical protein